MSVIGTVYLLCFADHGLPITHGRVARHYLGWTARPVEERIADHLKGQGSPLVAAVVDRHGPDVVTLARTWPGADRHYERALKNRRKGTALCPACHAAGRTPVLVRTNPPLRPLKRRGPGDWRTSNGLYALRRHGRQWVAIEQTGLLRAVATARTLRDLVQALA